jgi:hypothetical protein
MLERIMQSLPPLTCPLIQKENIWKTFANYHVSIYGSYPDVYGLTGELYVIWWKKAKHVFDNQATQESFTDNFKDAKTKALY